MQIHSRQQGDEEEEEEDGDVMKQVYGFTAVRKGWKHLEAERLTTHHKCSCGSTCC